MTELYKNIDNKTQCLLCPNNCLLNEGQFGLCGTRKCENKKIVNPYSGIISSTGIDPIEKKPLYHFMPSSVIFSVGFYGCTLKCQFCQNYSISQFHPDHLKQQEKLSPDNIVFLLKEKNYKSIAFTYSEPTLYFEWVLETSKLCRKNNIKTVLVTNGYLNKNPSEELLNYIDAANIDLKSGTDEFYKNICKGKIEPVKDFIKTAYEKKVHIELTTLIITDTNDSEEEMDTITDFISSISKNIPFHISRYHPSYKFSKPATNPEKIENLIIKAKKKLNYVYGGNISGNSETKCVKCGKSLINRDFYNISKINIDNKGNCVFCKEYNYFVME